jgi:hypothetical protein
MWAMFQLQGPLQTSWTVIVVTVLVKDDERADLFTLPKAYCISLPHDAML